MVKMVAVALQILSLPVVPFLPRKGTKIWWLFSVMAVLLMLFFGTVAVYASGWGGYISEKVIGRSGIGDSNLLIGRSGVSNSGLDVAMSGILTSPSISNTFIDGMGVAHATLRAIVTNLNGFPQATVYFEWGYDTGYGHTSASQVVVATGEYTSIIQGYDPSQTIYYRGVIETDGTNYSNGNSFLVGNQGIIAGFNLLNAVVVLLYATMVLFVVIAVGRESTIAALLVMALAIYLGVAFIGALQEAIRNIF